jgi:hypothetical protein
MSMTDSFDAVELAEAQLFADLALASLQKKYFPDVVPVYFVKVLDDPRTASCYFPETQSIQLYFRVARFHPLAELLILHELIHHKLFLQDPDYAKDPYGEPFRRETQELLKRGAYDKLL